MSDKIKVEIAQDSVQAIIQANVQTAVMEALLPHKEQFIHELVERSLLAKSKDSEYRYKKDHETPTLLEHMVRTLIAEEAKKAIIEWAQGHREEIGERIRTAMATKKFGRTIAAQIAEQMATCNDYSFKLEVRPQISGD